MSQLYSMYTATGENAVVNPAVDVRGVGEQLGHELGPPGHEAVAAPSASQPVSQPAASRQAQWVAAGGTRGRSHHSRRAWTRATTG